MTQEKIGHDRFIHVSMDPQKLQHFLAVHECGNFGQAASANNVTQQAVSKSIARLEEQLGLPLFERTAYGAVPTIYGNTLAKRAKIILSEARLAMAELGAMRGSTAGYVQVGLGWSFLPRLGPEAIALFRERRPGVGLRVVGGTSAELYPMLASGELDFVVSAPPVEFAIDPAVATQLLYTEHDAVVVRRQHPLARCDALQLEQLSGCTWLVALSIPDRWDAICNAFAARGIDPPNDIIDMTSLSLAKAMLIRGDYVCLLSEELVATEIETGDYVAFRLPQLALNRPALLATRRGGTPQAAAEVLQSTLLEVCDRYYPRETMSHNQ